MDWKYLQKLLMHKPILLFALLATSIAQPQYQDELTMIIGPLEGEKVHDEDTQPPANPNAKEDCLGEGGEVGECVPYHVCSAVRTIKQARGGLIDDLGGKPGVCTHYLDTCCRPAEKPREGCGWRNPDGVGFTSGILNDDGISRFGEFPWVVAVLNVELKNESDSNSERSSQYLASGSLIHPAVVLTAASKLSKDKNYRVRAGEWDTQTTKEMYPYQERDVKTIEIHETFNKKNLAFNIALLFLTAPMDPAPNVGVVCLPPASERAPGGARCFTSSWGKDEFGREGRYQVILKKAEAHVVEHERCQNLLRKTRLSTRFRLHETFMCAGREEVDSCDNNDSGAALVCPVHADTSKSERYQQNGIAAFSIGCSGEVPAVYADVAVLRTWIDDKITAHGLHIDVN